MYYTPDGMHYKELRKISTQAAHSVKNVVLQYGALASWKLSDISHNEISWKNSRKGLAERKNGDRILLLDDIRKDAEKVRPYDAIYDMYYDEFEDLEVAQ